MAHKDPIPEHLLAKIPEEIGCKYINQDGRVKVGRITPLLLAILEYMPSDGGNTQPKGKNHSKNKKRKLKMKEKLEQARKAAEEPSKKKKKKDKTASKHTRFADSNTAIALQAP